MMALAPRFSHLLTFGEVMLRLSPNGQRSFLQAERMESWVGGAEANVVTQLALLGHQVAIASRVPDNQSWLPGRYDPGRRRAGDRDRAVGAQAFMARRCRVVPSCGYRGLERRAAVKRGLITTGRG